MASTVADIMTSNVVTVEADAPIVDVARRMRDDGIGDVLVMDHGRLAGIVTDRDIVVRGIAEGRAPEQMTVRDVCSGEITTVTRDTSLQDAVRTMRQKAVRRLPVVDDGQPVGVVSIGDFAMEVDSDSALADISAADSNT